MGQGRGSAGQIVGLGSVIALVWLLALLHTTDAAVYTVGGADGWTFHVESWPQGKSFRAGDFLKFNYNPTFHNVVAVNGAGCGVPGGSKVYTSGHDLVRLGRGMNYFLCSFPGHCQAGMKIAVNAL